MTRKILLATAIAAFASIGTGRAETPATGTLMQPGQHMQIAGALGGRVVRQVMISPDGAGIDVVYDMPAGAPESRRVLRLENVNGKLEVLYDTKMPESRKLGAGGTPMLTAKGEGMYDVTYGK